MLDKAKKRETLSLDDTTSHWLHGNSIPKIGCYYFWPGAKESLRTPYLFTHSPTSTHKQTSSSSSMRERFTTDTIKVDLITLLLQSQLTGLEERISTHMIKGPHSLKKVKKVPVWGEPFFTQGQLAMQAK
jgi:hypothetical protein